MMSAERLFNSCLCHSLSLEMHSCQSLVCPSSRVLFPPLVTLRDDEQTLFSTILSSSYLKALNITFV